MLVLDGMVMTTIKDEFVYHEMVAHPALNTHPNPKKVLVVGGGDGGVIREVIKHPGVEKAVLVEIDGKVIEYSKQYLPEIAGKLDDPKVEVLVNDGYMHIIEHKNEYDVIMVDSTEPVGPAAPLFERGFYQGFMSAEGRRYFRGANGQPVVQSGPDSAGQQRREGNLPDRSCVWSEHSNLPKRSVDLYDGQQNVRSA